MTRRDDGDADDERRAHLPVESGSQNLEELEPHQQTIERMASVYYAGCRTAARAITAIKNQLSDNDEER